MAMSTVMGGSGSPDPLAPPDEAGVVLAGHVGGGDLVGSRGKAGRAFGAALVVVHPRSRTASAMLAKLRVSLVQRGDRVTGLVGRSLSASLGLVRLRRLSSFFLSHLSRMGQCIKLDSSPVILDA